MSKDKRPFWMPLFVAEFIADTALLTATQVGAYIRLLCAMWRSDDGTLPHDAKTLARIGNIHPPKWRVIWSGIKHLFDIDGDRVTSVPLQAELGRANARIVVARAKGSLGGQTTQLKRSMSTCYRYPKTPPKPLNNNDGAQAGAQA